MLASASAARRVESSYRTLLDEIDAPDLMVIAGCEAPANGTGCVSPTGETGSQTDETRGDLVIESLLATGVVEKARSVEYILPYFVSDSGAPLLGTPEDEFGCGDFDGSAVMVAANSGGGSDQSLPIRLDGELPLEGSGGVVLSRATADRAGLSIGQRVRLAGWCNGDGEVTELDVPIELTVSGLSVGQFDVEPPGPTQEFEPAHVDPVVFQVLIGAGGPGADAHRQPFVWLDSAASAAEVVEGLAAFYIVMDLRERTRVVDDALASDARLLWLLAAIGAFGGVLVLGPILGRNLRDTGPKPASLAAVGAQSALIWQQGVIHTVGVAIIGAVSAAILATPIASLMPRGLAAAIAPHRELWFDGLVTVVGVGVLVTVVVVIGLLAAWRIASGERRNAVRSSPRRAAAGWIRLRPASRTGVSAALGTPAGPRRSSPWPSLVSMVLVATTGVASVTYLAGLRHLEETPRVVGWNWDATIGFQFGSGDPAQVPEVIARLLEIDGIEQVTTGTAYPPSFLVVPDTEISFVWPWTFGTGPGAITPTILSGRAPTGPDEVAIDQVLAEQAGLAVGDAVSFGRKPLVARLADELLQNFAGSGIEDLDFAEYDDQLVVAVFEVTGIVVLPLERTHVIPQASFTLDGYADLVEPTVDELAVARAWLPENLPADIRMEVDSSIEDFGSIDELPTAVYLRFSGDTQSISEDVVGVAGVPEVVAPNPQQVLTLLIKLNVERTDRVPIGLSATVAALFVALASYLLFASVRARRFELAVMRALGMSTNGIRRSVAAQASATAVVSLIVAIPVGVLIGRWAWLNFARDLRVLPVAVIPWSTLALVAVAAIAFANIAALSLGWPAIRRSPGPDLRSE